MIKRKKRTNQVVVQTGPNWNDRRLDKGRVFVSVFEGRMASGEINKGHIKDYPKLLRDLCIWLICFHEKQLFFKPYSL